MTRSTTPRGSKPIPPLEPGDHTDQPTFHERYKQSPDDFRAELVEGIVFMPSPLGNDPSRYPSRIVAWLGQYVAATPGTDFKDNPTVILRSHSEPQPDAVLVVEPDRGGRTGISEDGFVTGPPELVIEVATSTEAYDLYEKRRDYERAGVAEHIVVAAREPRVQYFLLENGRFREEAATDGVFRSRAFPGLWLDETALLRLDMNTLLRTLRQGLDTSAHSTFVDQLTG